jgi:beta-glucosidase
MTTIRPTRSWPARLLVVAVIVAPSLGAQSTGVSALNSAPASQFADSILRLMTLDEKLGQLNQLPGGGQQISPADQQAIRAGRVGSFLNVFGADFTRQLQRSAVTQSRLKIPLLFAHDVIHGFRTIYPVPLAEAASFDSARAEFSALGTNRRGRGRRSVFRQCNGGGTCARFPGR